MKPPKTTIDLMQGTLSALVLKALSCGPLHGYAVARWIEQVSGEGLLVEEGSLYPTLHRLEERGWIRSEWQRSATNRRVKTYSLTAEGERQLRAELAQWGRFSSAVSRVLRSRRTRPA
jgi:transcriptional regulator